MPTRLIFDTDPGIDDAMALLFALRSPELEVVGVTTVFGNAGVEQTTSNALRILEVGGRPDIPVAMGAGQPLVRPPRQSLSSIHGADGLGNATANLPPRTTRAVDLSAAEYLVRTVLEQPGQLSLLAVGPLTNLALAVRLEPRLAGAVREVIVMGGSAYLRGNATPVAESNLRDDPEAAAIVFSAGWPLVMVGLDVTMRTVMTDDYLADFARLEDPAARFVSRVLPVYRQFYRDRYPLERDLPPYRPDGLPTHDPTAVAYAIDPSLFRTKRLPLWVETDGRCAGQTIPDPRRFWGDGPEVDVCLEVDAPRLLALFMEHFR